MKGLDLEIKCMHCGKRVETIKLEVSIDGKMGQIEMCPKCGEVL